MSRPLPRLHLAPTCCQPHYLLRHCLPLPLLLLLLSLLLLLLQIDSASGADTRERSHGSKHEKSPLDCQYNVTRVQSLEVSSSIFEIQGFSHCEFFIWAPAGLPVIRINLSQFHAVMPQGSLATQQARTTPAGDNKLPLSSPSPSSSQLSNEPNNSSSQLASAISTSFSTSKESSSPAHLPLSLLSTSAAHLGKERRQDKKSLKHSSSIESGRYVSGNREPPKPLHHGHNPHPPPTSVFKDNSSGPASSVESTLPHRLADSKGVQDSNSLLVFYQNRSTGYSTDTDCGTKLVLDVHQQQSSGAASPQVHVICWSGEPSLQSLVYQYSGPLRISFLWLPRSGSGFYLDVDFLSLQDVDCSLKCNSGHLCLRSDQLCDGVSDCPAQADENSTSCQHLALQQASGSTESVHIVLVVSAVLLFLLIVILVPMLRRSGRHHAVRHSRDAALLQAPHSQASEVCQSPGQEVNADPQTALLQAPHTPLSTSSMHSPGGRGKRTQPSSQQGNGFSRHSGGRGRTPGAEMYPPHIPLSRDGEEGYARAQRSLHSKHQQQRNWLAEHEVFRPPPNRTVYDRQSPPPPYSVNSQGTKSLDSLVPPGWLAAPTISPVVPRCHSLSYHRPPNATCPPHSRSPPEYHQVVHERPRCPPLPQPSMPCTDSQTARRSSSWPSSTQASSSPSSPHCVIPLTISSCSAVASVSQSTARHSPFQTDSQTVSKQVHGETEKAMSSACSHLWPHKVKEKDQLSEQFGSMEHKPNTLGFPSLAVSGGRVEGSSSAVQGNDTLEGITVDNNLNPVVSETGQLDNRHWNGNRAAVVEGSSHLGAINNFKYSQAGGKVPSMTSSDCRLK